MMVLSPRLFGTFVLVLVSLSGLVFPTERGIAADGTWKERTQIVWDKRRGELVRKPVRVWNLHPDIDLDFVWQPHAGLWIDSPDHTVTGKGTLVFYLKGAAEYDRKNVYSIFKGVLRNGRPEGAGKLAVRTGLSYTGEWADGLMHGRGLLRLENGDRYDGEFVAGKMHGNGAYTATDGTTYRGAFQHGLRDGAGTLIREDGVYQTVWREGWELARHLVPDTASAATWARLRLAAASSTIKMTLSLSRTRAAEFEDVDPDAAAHTYDAEYAPGVVTIGLASKAMRDAWKGSGPIAPSDKQELPYILAGWQFAPVFLDVTVENEGVGPAQITAAALEVIESKVDPTPYLEIHQAQNADCEPGDDYNPVLEIKNLGWGAVRDARMVYTLGGADKRTEEASVLLGTFDTAKLVSLVDHLRRLGVDTERLRKASVRFRNTSRLSKRQLDRYTFKCDAPAPAEPSSGADPDEDTDFERRARFCAEQIRESGVFGSMKDSVTVGLGEISTNVAGRIEYRANESDGQAVARTVSFEIDIPLANQSFEQGEMGCEDPIVRVSRASTLPLGRRNEQVALPKTWNRTIAPGEVRRFSLDLAAAKSSQHKLRVVLRLADGGRVISPLIDLTYFRPRLSNQRRR